MNLKKPLQVRTLKALISRKVPKYKKKDFDFFSKVILKGE
jgi:hypothetical protein